MYYICPGAPWRCQSQRIPGTRRPLICFSRRRARAPTTERNLINWKRLRSLFSYITSLILITNFCLLYTYIYIPCWRSQLKRYALLKRKEKFGTSPRDDQGYTFLGRASARTRRSHERVSLIFQAIWIKYRTRWTSYLHNRSIINLNKKRIYFLFIPASLLPSLCYRLTRCRRCQDLTIRRKCILIGLLIFAWK